MVQTTTEAAQLEYLAAESRHRPVWLRVGQLFDGTRALPGQCVDIVFDAKSFLFVGSEGRQPPADLSPHAFSEPDLELPEHTVIPCLIEAHAHLFLEGGPVDFAKRKSYLEQPASEKLAQARSRMTKLLHFGVGTVRDAGDKDGVGLALATESQACNRDLSCMPLLDSPGAAIHHRGRYGSFMGQPLEDYEDAAACVAGRVEMGADRIKLLVSGIINFKKGRVTAAPQMDQEEVSILVDAAKAFGKQTFAHASGTDGVDNAIEGGVTTVEHGFFVTKDQLARMRDRQIGWVPTFAPVQVQWERAEEIGWDQCVVDHLERILEAHREMLRHADRIGVPIVAGSDAGSCGVPHGSGFLGELVHMEKAGVASESVLRSATGVSKEVLDFSQPIGRIACGYRSRFVLTEHNPLATVANLQKDKSIFFDGTVVTDDNGTTADGM